MKIIAAILLLLTCPLMAQNAEGFNMNAFLKQIGKGKYYKINKIDNRKLEWRKEDFYGFEDVVSLWDESIFENDSVKKYFSPDDIKYIELQFKQDTVAYWTKTGLKSFRLIDSLKKEKIHKKNLKRRHHRDYYYAFSTPLYTIDGNFVLIKEEFDCGFMCVTFCSSLYRKGPDGEWVLVTHFIYVEA